MMICVGKIEAEGVRSRNAMFRYLSRNTLKGVMGATEVELLVETITEVTDSLNEDLSRELDPGEDDLDVLYPKFRRAVDKKAEQFKGDLAVYRQLTFVPSFVLGLAMAGRIGRHYMHSPWFTTANLGKMVGDVGGVSYELILWRRDEYLTSERDKFIADFITESVEILEQLANEEEPPLRRAELEAIRDRFGQEDADKDELRGLLSGMKGAFQKRGDLSKWGAGVLDHIDECFREHFMIDREASDWVFYPKNGMNLGKAERYYAGVDRILSTYSEIVPRYARDWFAYFSIWEEQGYAFPMPVGTCSVVGVVEKYAREYSSGIVEVS